METHLQALSEPLKVHIRCFNGYTIFGFMLARLAGNVTLFYISTATLRPCENFQFGECPDSRSIFHHPIRECRASSFFLFGY